ncbi:outer membrane protein assembly factor BamB family protein [Pseudohaliea rubra]|uniref:Putative cell surface protein/ lipoprotein n=1 Tax=Pseudohaliea rubra DSM 19751 TaxID=1265313 RepID=A0A095VS56_9GAMM|nr:PQQ-binding-like beta-propeller repeat protein [Pseudohaliea rubra]KGE03928.1 putative cell surface protein/ lipoprotein [Pseudohaliea rubra DSM 19751]
MKTIDHGTARRVAPLARVGAALLWMLGCIAGSSAVAADRLTSTDDFQTASVELGERSALPGAGLFARACGACHYGGVYKAPHFSWLELMPPRTLYHAMTKGVMASQAAELSEAEKVQVVEYLTQKPFDPAAVAAAPSLPRCSAEAAVFDRGEPFHPVTPGHDTRRYLPSAVAGLSASELPSLELKWAFAFPGATRARSQPTAGMGAIFVGSQDGTVYAFDVETGCVRWTFQAAAEVRTGVVLDRRGADDALLFFGDIIANFYAVDALTGDLRWKQRVDEHPSATLTATPAVHADRVYVPVSSLEVVAAADAEYPCCSFRGKVLALDRATGSPQWTAHAIEEEPAVTGETPVGTAVLSPSGAPVWTTPTVIPELGLLVFGTGENYSSPADGNSDAIVAVDLASGERRWVHQVTPNDAWNVACMMADNPNCPEEDGPDYDQGSSVLWLGAGGPKILVAGHKSGHVTGHDPRDGRELWRVAIGRGSIQGGVHFGMAAEGAVVYAPVNDMNNTRNGDVLDPALARPGMHAVDARTGELLWSRVNPDQCGDDRPFCDPGISAAVTAIPGAVLAGHLDGVLRAYDRASGELLWHYDTTQAVTGTNGETARGGGMSGGAGAFVYRGHVIANSGYGLYYHEPGNALLVFAPASKDR